jgi:hypothetical protein
MKSVGSGEGGSWPWPGPRCSKPARNVSTTASSRFHCRAKPSVHRVSRVLIVAPLRVEDPRQREVPAHVVAEQLDGAAEVPLGFRVARERVQGLAQITPGAPRVRVGGHAALEPGHRALAIASVPGDAGEVIVWASEPGIDAYRLLEQSRRARRVPVAHVALPADQRELLHALGDLTAAGEADLEVADARVLVALRRGEPRALDDHDAAETDEPLVAQPLAVPPDAVRVVGLGQSGQPEEAEAALARWLGGDFATVVAADLDHPVTAGQPTGAVEVALLHQDVDLQLHDEREKWILLEEPGA